MSVIKQPTYPLHFFRGKVFVTLLEPGINLENGGRGGRGEQRGSSLLPHPPLSLFTADFSPGMYFFLRLRIIFND
jgi:hypothetical protein